MGPWRRGDPIFVRAEIIVTQILRRLSNGHCQEYRDSVKDISEVGARGHLKNSSWKPASKGVFRTFNIQKNETDAGYDTRKILQYTRLLMPVTVSQNDSAAEKLRAYKNPAQCLADFSEWYSGKGTDPIARAKYEFTVQMAPFAIEEYEYWELHDAWNGQRVFQETNEKGRASLPPPSNWSGRDQLGLTWPPVFPILGAMSEFTKKCPRISGLSRSPRSSSQPRWSPARLRSFAASIAIPCSSAVNPGAYDALRIYPNTLITVMRDMQQARARSGEHPPSHGTRGTPGDGAASRRISPLAVARLSLRAMSSFVLLLAEPLPSGLDCRLTHPRCSCRLGERIAMTPKRFHHLALAYSP